MAPLIRAGALVSSGILLGRLLGVGRDIVVFRVFGVSRATDVAVVALSIPDLLSTLLIGGAFGAALIPEFSEARQRGEGLAQGKLFKVGLFAIGFGLAVAGLLALLSEPILTAVAPGFRAEPDTWTLTNRLFDVIVFQAPLGMLAGVLTAWLHARQDFLISALGTAVVNLTIICGLMLWGSDLLALGVTIVIAALVRAFSQLLRVWRLEAPWRPAWHVPITSHVPRRYLEAFLAQGLLFALPVVARAFASTTGVGSVALLNLSWKLIQLPAGVLLGVGAVVGFPAMTALNIRGNSESSRRLGGNLAALASGLGAVIAVGVILYAGPLSDAVADLTGLSEEEQTHLVTLVVVFAVALPVKAYRSIQVALLQARGDTASLLRGSFAGFLLFMCAAFPGARAFGILGLAIAWVSTDVAQTWIFHWLLKRGGGGLAPTLTSGRMFGATALGLMILVGGYPLQSWIASGEGLIGTGVACIVVGLAAAAYALFLWAVASEALGSAGDR